MTQSRFSFLISTYILTLTGLFGQTIISGTVFDSNQIPIIGANIYLKNSYDGISSDASGKFLLTTSLRDSQTLIISYLGYRTYKKYLFLSDKAIELSVILHEDTYDLDGVVITAGSFEGGGEKKREVLKPMDIVTTAGATADIAGALNTLPGTQIVGESGRLYVRGGEGYETKTFIDGLQVLGFYSPSAPNTPSRSRFMPYMFSGTSFSTGGYSAEYGQALSSALILNSKFLAAEDRIDLSIMTVGGDVSFSKSWKNASIVGKTQYTNLRPYYSLIPQHTDWIDPPESFENSFSYKQKISDTGILKVYSNINRSDFTLNSLDIIDPELKTKTHIDNDYDYFNALIHEKLDNSWEIKGGISYTKNNNDISLNQEIIGENDKGIHSKLMLKKSTSTGNFIKIGGEYFYRKFGQDYSNPDTKITSSLSYADHLSSLFVESDIKISRSLITRIGLRGEYSSLNDLFTLAPRVSFALKTSKNGQVSAAYGIFYQAPQNRFRMINHNLSNEKAAHYIINYEMIHNNRTFRVELFQKSYSDLIKYSIDNQWSPAYYRNTGHGYARGLDVFWRDSRTISNLEYWISYSYLNSQRDYLDFPYHVSPSFLSKHNLSIVAKKFINPLRASTGLTYTFSSGRPYNDPNEEKFMDQMTPSYHDLSANISFLLKRNMILHVSATNILGRDHVFNYEFSSLKNSDGQHVSREIGSPSKHFLFVGFFLTLSKNQIINQLPNL